MSVGFNWATLPSNIWAYLNGKTRIGVRSVNLGAGAPMVLANNLTLGAGLVGTAVEAAVILPQYCKILKVAVAYASIDLFNDTESFNIVVDSSGDYVEQGPSVPPIYNKTGTPFGGSAGFAASGYAPGTGQPIGPADNSETPGPGYPTQFAAVGDCLFQNDITFGADNFTGNGAGTTGGGQVFAPTNWDGVYAAGTILSLRASTTASTGAITGLCVTLWTQSVDKIVSNDRAVPLYAW